MFKNAAVEKSVRPSDEFVARSFAMILSQTRVGTVLAMLLGAMFGVLFVPAVGWLFYLLWYGTVAAGFFIRQIYFERVAAKHGATPRSLRILASVSALTGWIASLCVPLFSRYLTVADIAVLTTVMVGWISIAVSILYVQPQVYKIYLLVCLATVYTGWFGQASPRDLAVIGIGMLIGGFMLARLAQLLWTQLRDIVDIGQQNTDLVGQLRRSLELQKEAQSARSRFLGAASHDLRQPVHAMLLLMDIFKRSSDSTRRAAVAEQVVRTAESIDSMFKGLIDLAQIDAGTVQVSIQSIDLGQLVQGATSGFAEKCAAKGIAFLQQPVPSLVVMADPVLLERILRNLLDNALKFSLKGAITLAVTLEGDEVTVAVEDQGVGMEVADLQQAFTAFFRGKSASLAEAEGIGLGLAICQHMAELMGSELHLSSTQGVGTRASMTLRRATSLLPRAGSPGESPKLYGLKVIVLEDERLSREALTLWLVEAGAKVLAGASLGALMPSLRSENSHIDVIVADYRLGDGANGLDAIRSLRQEFGHIPALIVSGEPKLDLGVQDIPVLQKPVSPAELMHQIHRLCRRTHPPHQG